MLCSLLFFFILHSSFAQTKTISGTVKDDKDNPVAGASISVKGTNTGTATDAAGNFTLQDFGKGQVLLISSVGVCPTRR